MSVLPMHLHLGLGIGWREELAGFILGRQDLGFVEVIAETVPSDGPLPLALEEIRRRGATLVPHGVSLSLGGAEEPDSTRLGHLASLAERLGAPLVSEHIAFVRGGGLEAGHLLPVPRTKESLEILVDNVRIAQGSLPVPLALEHIAALFEWPGAEMDEADFLTESLERTGALLLLDLANVHANALNHRADPLDFLDRLPLKRLAYVHVAGGTQREGLYHDTHAHPVPAPVLELVEELCTRQHVPGVMLERDELFPTSAELNAELDAIAGAAARGTGRRHIESAG